MTAVTFLIARAIGTFATFVASRVGNGSVIGGRLALVVAPHFVRYARRYLDFPIVFVMGSNGKTTTAKYLVHLASEAGERVLTNTAGSNMKTGIAALIIREWTRIRRGQVSLGVFEIDEAYAASIAADLAPEFAVITNVQIDQIYRLHEPERVRDMFAATIPHVTRHVVINANDALLVDAARRHASVATVSTFGVDLSIDPSRLGLFAATAAEHSASATLIAKTAGGYCVTHERNTEVLVVPTTGVHFALNGAAAIATAMVVLDNSTSFATHVARVACATPAFGRGESMVSGKARFEIVLFKNRPSLQLNLDAVDSPADTVVLAFDEYSQDPSWLFAVDYSSLDRVDWVSGEKADFLALALAYAGIEVGGSNTNITEVVRAIDVEYRDKAEPSVHRLFLDYDQMMATRTYFGRAMGATS
jgi:UDP-N-acetylmuramyl tripeptide synthase